MGDTEREFKQRNGVTLREYMDVRFDSLETLFNSKIAEIERSTKLARESMERQLDRATSESDAITSKFSAEIKGLEKFRSMLEGKASTMSVVLACILAAGSLILGVIRIITQ